MSELDELAVELFKTFARFEYALKAAGFRTMVGDAKADWTAFANSIPIALKNHRNANVKAAVDYMEIHPPQKQVVQNNLLAWDPALPGTNNHSDKILIYVRRVRNNLFHGGKFNDHWFAPQRDAQLLRHSLTILHACLEESVDVKTAYRNK